VGVREDTHFKQSELAEVYHFRTGKYLDRNVCVN